MTSHGDSDSSCAWLDAWSRSKAKGVIFAPPPLISAAKCRREVSCTLFTARRKRKLDIRNGGEAPCKPSGEARRTLTS